MIRVEHTYPTGSILTCFVHGNSVGLWTYNQTQSIISVYCRHTLLLPEDLHVGLRIDAAQLKHVEVSMQSRNAVRIDTATIGLAQHFSCKTRIVPGNDAR